ncbi:acetyl-CoA carboxylase biotin carboxyl carrier protein subunit, partial [Micromonospora craterilacus]
VRPEPRPTSRPAARRDGASAADNDADKPAASADKPAASDGTPAADDGEGTSA